MPQEQYAADLPQKSGKLYSLRQGYRLPFWRTIHPTNYNHEVAGCTQRDLVNSCARHCYLSFLASVKPNNISFASSSYWYYKRNFLHNEKTEELTDCFITFILQPH